MNEERGASLRLLYQIKLGIQKYLGGGESNEVTEMKTMTNIKGGILQNRLQQTKQLSEELLMSGSLDGKLIRTMNKSKKLEAIEKTQLKFQYKQIKLEEKAWQDQKNEEELIRKLQQDMRQKNLQVMEENRQFMKDWEKEGKGNWRKNMKRKQDMLDRQKYFEDKEVTEYKNKLNRILDEATRDMSGGIDEYEKNLQKLGIDSNITMQEAMKKMEEKKGVPPGQIQNFSYAATMNRIKEKKHMSDFAAKERDRRRRKLIVDQAKTQSDLEKKKTEEQLVAKLLEKQQQETKLAYLERRSQNCKELITKNRTLKATDIADKRQLQIQEMEEQKKQDQQSINEKRKEEFSLKKKEYSKVRRQEKLKKRQVSIEVCSEVLDLIVDIADVAFDQQVKGNQKLSKPQWREWMDTFVSNKLVSHGMIDAFASSRKSILEDEQADQDTNIYDSSIGIEDILYQHQQDTSYSDLISYLSVSGQFDLASSKSNEWLDFYQLGTSNYNDITFQNIDFQFLNSALPPQSSYFGSDLSRLLKNLYMQDKTSLNQEGEGQQVTTNYQLEFIDLPNYLPIKLSIIGRSYSGKRTSATMLNDIAFKQKLKVFRMDELIKEVVEYVTPKQVIEVPIDKKAKAPAKGKQEEVYVDPYQGKDTTSFKEIGQAIKKSIGEGLDMSGQDLINLVSDDTLLIRLFAQKLKLVFPADKSEETKQEEIKAKILREREILQQLQEIEAANANVGDPKAKKAAAPAKGKGAVSNEETLKQELEEVLKPSLEGWILVDFPRTLKQAKLFEQLMNGYTCILDQQKSEEQQKFEQWSKLVTPETVTSEDFKGELAIQKSIFDGVIIMDVASDECTRRGKNRKIDPQTNTIYHLEDNPPPENDNKLKDRLQEYKDPEADHSRMMRNHSLFDSQVDNLKRWYDGFGLKDEQLENKEKVNSLIQYSLDSKIKKEEVTEQILKELQAILEYKQQQYEVKKKQILEEMNKQVEIQQEQNVEGEEAAVQEEKVQNTDEDENRLQVMQEAYRTKSSELRSGHSIRAKSSVRTLREYSDKDKKGIWDVFESTYYRDALYVFTAIRRQRDMVFEGFNETQRRFIDFLERPSSKQAKINDFIDSFNKFSEEFPDLREDEQTKEELYNRTETLSADLWKIIEKRKDEALEERKKIMENGWIQHEINKLIKYAAKIIQSELNKYDTIYQISVGKEIQTSTIDVESSFLYLVEQGIQSIDEYNNSPIIIKLFTQILRRMESQGNEAKQLTDQRTKDILYSTQQNILFRLNMIKTWISLKIKEFSINFKEMCELLDDWIVDVVAKENEVSQKLIKEIKAAISEEQLSLSHNQYDADPKNLNQILECREFYPSQSINQGVTPTYAVDYYTTRFKVKDLLRLFNECLYYSFQEFLDQMTFTHLLVLAFQESRVPKYWQNLGINVFYDVIQRVKVVPALKEDENSENYEEENQSSNVKKREFINWRETLQLFVLATAKTPTFEELKHYSEVYGPKDEEIYGKETEQFWAFVNSYSLQPAIMMKVTEMDEDFSDEMIQDIEQLREQIAESEAKIQNILEL